MGIAEKTKAGLLGGRGIELDAPHRGPSGQ